MSRFKYEGNQKNEIKSSVHTLAHALSHTLLMPGRYGKSLRPLRPPLYPFTIPPLLSAHPIVNFIQESHTHGKEGVWPSTRQKKKWQKRSFKNVVSPKPLFSKICSTVYWRRESEALRQQADLLLTSWLMGRNMKQETVGWIFFTMLFQRPKISIISLIHSHVKTTVHLWIVALSSLFIKSGLKHNPLIQPLVMSQMVVLPLSC